MLVKSNFTFENFSNFVIRKHVERYFRKFRVLPEKLVAMVTPDNLENQKKFFLMLHGLILKITKFQLPFRTRLGAVVKNILGGHLPPPPLVSNCQWADCLQRFQEDGKFGWISAESIQQEGCYSWFFNEYSYRLFLKSVLVIVVVVVSPWAQLTGGEHTLGNSPTLPSYAPQDQAGKGWVSKRSRTPHPDGSRADYICAFICMPHAHMCTYTYILLVCVDSLCSRRSKFRNRGLTRELLFLTNHMAVASSINSSADAYVVLYLGIIALLHK